MPVLGVDSNDFYSWLIVGAAVGIVVHIIDPGDIKGGVLGALLAGMLGAIVGGLLAPLLFGISITGFNMASIPIATVGALIFVILERLMLRNTGHIKTTTKKII